MAKPHCQKCKGLGFIIRRGELRVGGKVIRVFEYQEECSWCREAFFYREDHR
jgi:hypothetical protein